MRIGVYGLPGYPPTAAAARGLVAVGHRALWRRASLFRPDMTHTPFDAVMVYGLHRGEGRVAERYQELGVPVIVIDLAYLRREWQWSQVGLNSLCWLPPFPCPSDRWKRLKITPEPYRDAGDYILVAGQRPGDASHNLGRMNYAAWMNRTIEQLRASTQRPIWFRPHPRDKDLRPNLPVDRISHPENESIDQAMEGAQCVVTYNSTVGTEAIVAGVPVICDPVAMYAPWCETDLRNVDTPFRPTNDDRLQYLYRVGYSQWSPDELASGEAMNFILAVVAGEVPVQSDGPKPPRPRSKKSVPLVPVEIEPQGEAA